ncbi:MAG: trehalose synthase [Actinomycetia bacterium]|nr:trehalose synthase [Actinomycetes bacterium]
MLERVPLLEKDLGSFAEHSGEAAIERIRELAGPLKGARVLHVNATAYGGGVAELLATHVPLLNSAGLHAEWQVIRGSDQFFAVTKQVHNALQGADIDWTLEMERVYLDMILDNAQSMEDEGEYDFIVIHDPQPAALLHYLRESPINGPSTKWIWRCHIDLTDVNERVWRFFRPFVEQHDASVWTMPEYVPSGFDMDRIVIAPPCIDPLSVKNMELPGAVTIEVCRKYGIDVRRPVITQVSRFDPWKDPLGVMQAFNLVREDFPDAQLVLAGSMATDDPEGFQIWEDIVEARGGDDAIHLLSNLQQVGNIEINAFQAQADVVVQKSLREGFGLTVSEGLWKARPVVGGRAGGITRQIVDGENGYLVDSIEECATAIMGLLKDPVRATEMGESGREYVRERFLSTREVIDWLDLFTALS